MDELITAKQAAEILGVSDRWIRYMLEKGEISGQRLSGQWAISRQSVLDYKARKDANEKSGTEEAEQNNESE
jgi:excisionase family DNA binding protein